MKAVANSETVWLKPNDPYFSHSDRSKKYKPVPSRDYRGKEEKDK